MSKTAVSLRVLAYRDWQRQQERRELFQQLQVEAGDLGGVRDGEAFNRQLSVVLTADLALAGREVMDKVEDPSKSAECLAQLSGKIALLRREESNTVRARVVREGWERKLAKAEAAKRTCGTLMPDHALLLQRLYIDMFSRGDDVALVLGRNLPQPPSRPVWVNPIRLNPA